jgi:hypothetical protein
MAKIFIGKSFVTALLRTTEDLELQENNGKAIGHIRYLKEYAEEGNGDWWELEIPSWDYPEQHFMVKTTKN